MAKRSKQQNIVNKRIRSMLKNNFPGNFESGLRKACDRIGPPDQFREGAKETWLRAASGQ